MDLNEFYELVREDEQERLTSPRCVNCRDYYEEYGHSFCKKRDNPESDIYNSKCEQWR